MISHVLFAEGHQNLDSCMHLRLNIGVYLKKHAYEIHAYKMHACKVHAYKMHV